MLSEKSTKPQILFLYLHALSKQDLKALLSFAEKQTKKTSTPYKLLSKAVGKREELIKGEQISAAQLIFGRLNPYPYLDRMIHLVEQFLILQILEKKETAAATFLKILSQLPKVKMVDYVKLQVSRFEQTIDQSQELSIDKYLALHFFYKKLFLFNTVSTEFSESFNYHNKAIYYLEKYSIAFDVRALIENYVINRNYQSSAMQELPLPAKNYEDVLRRSALYQDTDPFIAFHAALLRAFNEHLPGQKEDQINFKVFEALTAQFEALAPSLSDAEQNTLGILVINFCSQHIRENKKDFVRKAAEIFYVWTKQQWLIENDTISPQTFLHAVSLCCHQNHLQRAEEFIQENAIYLDPKRKHNVIKQAKMILLFYQEDYQACLDCYANTDDYPQEPSNRFRVRLYLLRARLKLALKYKSDEDFEKSANSFRAYLRFDRLEDMSDDIKKNSLMETLLFYQKIVRSYFIDNRKGIPPEEIEALKVELLAGKTFAKQWTMDLLDTL